MGPFYLEIFIWFHFNGLIVILPSVRIYKGPVQKNKITLYRVFFDMTLWLRCVSVGPDLRNSQIVKSCVFD